MADGSGNRTRSLSADERPGPIPVSAARGRLVDVVLWSLVIFDLLVAVGAFLLPQLWFRILHDAEFVDPQGLLRRTGAIWVAFAVLQILALPRWRSASHWLLLVTASASARCSPTGPTWHSRNSAAVSPRSAPSRCS